MSAQDDLRRGARQLRRDMKRLADEAWAAANDAESNAVNLNASGRKNIIVTRNTGMPGSVNLGASHQSAPVVQRGSDDVERTTVMGNSEDGP